MDLLCEGKDLWGAVGEDVEHEAACGSCELDDAHRTRASDLHTCAGVYCTQVYALGFTLNSSLVASTKHFADDH